LAAHKKVFIHPGKVLKEEFLVPLGISANRLAISLSVPPNRISGIINGERAVTADS
jgi:addiction module HigA family antidote